MKIKNHPILKEFLDFNLKDDYLNWEIHDFVDSYIDFVSEEAATGVFHNKDFTFLNEIINGKYQECLEASKLNPENQVLSHNLAIVSLVAVNIKLSAMCIPDKAA